MPQQEGEWKVVPGRWPNRREVTDSQKRPEITAGRFASLMICPVGVNEANKSDVQEHAEICNLATEVTVDSAAEESVCPLNWAKQFGLTPVAKGCEMGLVNASGGKISHLGSRKVVMHAAEDGRALEMTFQVTDVKKPLLAVSRLCERGNLVQFGPEPHQNFVQNVSTGVRLALKRRGNSWVLPGEFAQEYGF